MINQNKIFHSTSFQDMLKGQQGKFSIKADVSDCCEFLLGFLHSNPSEKGSTLKERICSQGEIFLSF